MINKKWHCILLVLSLGWLSSCISTIPTRKVAMNKHSSATPKLNNAPPINIWIHGTFFFPNYMLPKFFYCPTGLNLATVLDTSYHHRLIAQTLAEADPERFPLKTFYLFGWSGKLSFSAREKAARELYTALKKLIAKYEKKYNQKPFIRIITHSHGGNVVLNMEELQNSADDIHIAELILLACPVQERTKRLAQDERLFPKIISLFSTLDTMQVLDPQGLYQKEIHEIQKQYEKRRTPLFSEREFEPHSNLTQVKLKISERGLFHIEFMLKRFLRMMPTILDEIRQWEDKDKTVHEKIYLLKLST